MENNPVKNMYQGQDLPALHPRRAALLCIDIQYHDAAPDFGFFQGKPRSENAYYFDRLEQTVFPNVRKLQDFFRANHLEIIHARICSLTTDGRDRSLEHKRIGCHVAPGSKAAQFIDCVAPAEDEIILNKTGSGVFNTTNLDYLLKNLGIEQLIITGVLTNECIETAVRDAADRSYTAYIVEDGVAALTQELHDSSLRTLNGVYGFAVSARQMLSMLEAALAE